MSKKIEFRIKESVVSSQNGSTFYERTIVTGPGGKPSCYSVGFDEEYSEFCLLTPGFYKVDSHIY